MSKVIIGGSNTLVRYILFGDEKVKHKYLHIPRVTRWIDSEKSMDDLNNKDPLLSRIYANFKSPTIKKQTNEKIDIDKLSDLQIAISLCKPGNFINSKIL